MSGSLKLSLVQLDPAWETPPANIEKASRLIVQAVSEGASVAIFPEMFTTGFSMNGHSINGAEAKEALSALASGNNINLLAGISAPSGVTGPDKGVNKALAFDSSGQLVSEYIKIHPFSFAQEDRHYAPGTAPVTFTLAGAESSVFICYDLRFPEVFRKVAREVKIIYVLANWPASRQEHWHTLLRARAIENQCFVAGVNRVGTDGNGIAHAGGSSVYGPFGEEVLIAGDREGQFVVDLELSLVDTTRAKYPFLGDMKA